MRTSIVRLGVGLVLVSVSTASAASYVASLEAYSRAGACGGDVHCTQVFDKSKSPATNTDMVTAPIGNTLADGSYANATGTASFGALHAYADAYRVATSDAQSAAEVIATDVVSGGGGFVNSFSLTGSHTSSGATFANDAGAYILWEDIDVQTGALLDHGLIETTDADPAPTFTDTVAVPTGHDVYTLTELFANAYSSYGYLDVADYADTLHYYLTSVGGGPDIVGVSGHDYALPAASVGGVPEPGTWALMLLGFGAAGVALRGLGRRAAVGRLTAG